MRPQAEHCWKLSRSLAIARRPIGASGRWRRRERVFSSPASLVLFCTFILGAVLGSTLASTSAAQEVNYSRPVAAAPQPESIGADYQLPAVQHVPPRGQGQYALDVVLLVAAMAAVAYACHRGRRRMLVTATTLLALGYFGFWRQGCVCPIGATQNVAASLADPTVGIPWVVIAFFFLPLGATLLFGRVFCGGACALGAIQDVVVLRPVQLPLWVDRWLGKFRYVYLAAAVWFAVQPAPARDFIICRFDPFIGVFRLSGTPWVIGVGVGLLALGTFIGRPYCRFLCPYGGLLAVVSRFAWRAVSITPDREIDCRLCSTACPFGAIENCRASRTACLACARCFASCPRQHAVWNGETACNIGPAPLVELSPPPREPEEVLV